MEFDKIINTDPRKLQVRWMCTYKCNFCCSYCTNQKERTLDDFREIFSYYNKIDHKEIAKEIDALLVRSGCEKNKVELIGGEVTLLPLEEIIDCMPHAQFISITSNFSADNSVYEKIARKVKLHVTCSFHPEFFYFEDFFEKFKNLKTQSKSMEIVLNKSSFELVKKAKKLCDENGFRLLIDPDRTEDGSRDLLNQLKDTTFSRTIIDKDGKEKKTRVIDLDALKRMGCAFCTQGLNLVLVFGEYARHCNGKNFYSFCKIPDYQFSSSRCTKLNCNCLEPINIFSKREDFEMFCKENNYETTLRTHPEKTYGGLPDFLEDTKK